MRRPRQKRKSFHTGSRHGSRGKISPALLAGLLLPLLAATAAGQSPEIRSPGELKQLSFEELLNIEVTSVSKSPERLDQAASAIQVISGEDIKRSGATNLADAMRLAPNLSVQQIHSHAWVVSSRGFNALYANKLLVMIDGRTVYTPLYAGVLWDAQNVLLEDIDRIEVISGPGGTLWGANAVNGVINITTKSAKETHGVYLSGAAGSFLENFGAVRVGGQANEKLHYRVYAQRHEYEGTRTPAGDESQNAWEMLHAGFRTDYDVSDVAALTVQGDLYFGEEYDSPAADSTLDGQNLLGRWTRTFSQDSEIILQMYFDRTWRRDIVSTISDELLTYDFDFQHRLPLGDEHNLIWGAGYRLMEDETKTNTQFVGYRPEHRTLQLFSAFIQDEINVIPDLLRLTVGSKFEHNDYSGFEVQPNVRLAWTPTERQTVWSAVSRAVRTPSRIDVDLRIPNEPPFALIGGPDFDSEKMVAYELGYRVQPTERLTTSLALFYNDYDDLYSVEPVTPGIPVPISIQNGTNGHSWGAELSGTFQATENWRLRGGYTFFDKELWSNPGHAVPPNVLDSLGNDPENQFVLQSMLNVSDDFQIDVTARYVDSLSQPRIPSYLTFDLRLAWQIRDLEIALVGRNLADDQHPEFQTGEEIPRSFYGKVSWRF